MSETFAFIHRGTVFVASVAILALPLYLFIASSLDRRWVAGIAVLSVGFALWLVGQMWRPVGTGYVLSTSGLLLASGGLVVLLVFLLVRSARSPWLVLLAPVFVLFYLSPFLKGLRPHTVRLAAITLGKAGIGVGGRSVLRVAHLSDLHLCNTPAMEGALPPDRVRRAAEEALRWALDQADFAVLTGDLTDSGKKEEWDILADILGGLGASRVARIHVVPGNHDLSIAGEYRNPNDGSLVLDHEEQHRHFATSILGRWPAARCVRTRGAESRLSEVFSQAATYIKEYEAHPPTVDRRPRLRLPRAARGDPFARFADLVPAVVIDPGVKQAASEQAAGSLWPTSSQLLFMDLVRGLYPMVFDEDERYVSIGLNSSTAMANSILSGALGLLGEDQLERLDALLDEAGQRCKIITLHHHVGLPDMPEFRSLISRAMEKTLQLRDAAALHRILVRHGNVVVFHGHEHIGYHASRDGVVVVSGPSVAYGDRAGGSNCIVYEIDPQAGKAQQLVRVLETATFTAA